MKYLAHLSVFTVIVVLITFCGVCADDAAHQGGCYDEDTNHFWPTGQSYNPIGHCISMNCISDDGVFDALPCATYLQPEGECEVIDEDLTKPYPDCCPTMKCKEKEKEEASEAPVTEGVAGE
ncbi:unnamed protein product [Hermetia illucens]|uniref:Single domain-containing protein n=1 Tax=Hermetia illucens TaxID=343691 RepID=A0A7R8UVP6_HERIL|nr:la1-like protein 13 [Hermetia illucens]CAD7086768.1 unnamed protein product [Hermetia illucens]